MAHLPLGLPGPCRAAGTVATLLLAGALGGCGASRTSAPLPTDRGCAIVAAGDSIDGAWPLTLAFDPHPFPFTPAVAGFPEDFGANVTAVQVSETLIRLDCRGQPMPGLAASWSASADGRFWTFVLRQGAHFSDGSAVTAADVTRSFAEVSTTRPWSDAAGMLVGWAGIQSARVRGDSVLVLEFAAPAAHVPTVLSHPALVTVKPTAGQAIGSGPFQVTAARAGRVRMAAPGGPALTMTRVEGDVRDALDAGIDLVVTRDARALAYASGLPEYDAVPLPWDDLYALVQPPSGHLPIIDPRQSRFEEIIRVSSRTTGAEPPRWWRGLGACRLPAPERPSGGRRHRLVYQAEDPVARNTAERLAVLVEDAPGLVVDGLADAAFWHALRSGGDWGYILRLPAAPVAPCLTAAQLRQHVPWLRLATESGEATARALVETRPHAIVRPARVAGRVDLDGNGAVIIVGTP